MRAGRQPPEPLRTILATLLIGLFATMATVATADLVARVLPAAAETVTIVDRDTHEFFIRQHAPRSWLGTAQGYRLTVEAANGAMQTIDVPKTLYDRALPGSMAGTAVTVRRSALLGKVVAVQVEDRPLVDLTELNELLGRDDAAERETVVYSTHLEVGLVVGALFLFGLAASLMVRLPRKDVFAWPAFGLGMVVAVALGLWWWSAW